MSNTWVIIDSRGRGETHSGAEEIDEETMTKTFPNLVKDIQDKYEQSHI